MARAGERGDHGQHAGHGLQRAVERQLTEQRHRAAARPELVGGDEDADGDGQVVGRAVLAPIRRRQVDRDPAGRIDEAGIADGGPDPLARLRQCGVRQADDVAHGQPGLTSTSTRTSAPRRPLTTAVTSVASTPLTLARPTHQRLTARSPGVSTLPLTSALRPRDPRRTASLPDRQLVAAASCGRASPAAAWRSMARDISTTARPMIESGLVNMNGAPLLRALMAAR